MLIVSIWNGLPSVFTNDLVAVPVCDLTFACLGEHGLLRDIFAARLGNEMYRQAPPAFGAMLKRSLERLRASYRIWLVIA
jgi:hypothetical protein